MFDAVESERLKNSGMEMAAESRKELLEEARAIALALGDRVSANEVAEEMHRRGLDPRSLGNAAGSIFRDGNWMWQGEWTKATRVVSHARDLRVWRRKEAA